IIKHRFRFEPNECVDNRFDETRRRRTHLALYFKYRTLDQLQAECRRLGLSIRFRENLDPLFRPVSSPSLRIGNSFCIQPMEGCDGTPDGKPGDLTFRRFERFGAGGAKLLWGEATAVVEEGRASPRQLLLNDANAPAL